MFGHPDACELKTYVLVMVVFVVVEMVVVVGTRASSRQVYFRTWNEACGVCAMEAAARQRIRATSLKAIVDLFFSDRGLC